MKWDLEAAADQLGEISLLKDAPRDWLVAEAQAVVEAAFTCPHDDAGEGAWCYLCWTNIKTGEVYPDDLANADRVEWCEAHHMSTNPGSIRCLRWMELVDAQLAGTRDCRIVSRLLVDPPKEEER